MNMKPQFALKELEPLIRLLAKAAVRRHLEQARSNQKATAPSQPEPTPGNSGRRSN